VVRDSWVVVRDLWFVGRGSWAAAAGGGKVRCGGWLAGYGWLRPREVASPVAMRGVFRSRWRRMVAVVAGVGGCGGG